MSKCTDCAYFIDKCHDTNFNYRCKLTGAIISEVCACDADMQCSGFRQKENIGEPVRMKDEPFTVCTPEPMDIVEFAELIVGKELYQWQKDALRTFSKLDKNVMIVAWRGGYRVITRKEEQT